jgi:serine/threonine protein kinase
VHRATLPARDGELNLALKEPRIQETLDIDKVEDLMQEAETWQQLDDHDHIVSIVDYDSSPIPWIAMEYMDGGHLGDRAGELPFEQALSIAIAITEGIKHAHDRGVAHLDIKPENILFQHRDDVVDTPKIADWGLSKHLFEHSKSVEGLSPQYAAPEQFDSDDYGTTDNVTDIYQLSAVLYELFTGQPPYEGDPFEIMSKVRHDEPIPPSELADVPKKIDEILLTALSTEKTERYEDIIYVRDDLRAVLDD